MSQGVRESTNVSGSERVDEYVSGIEGVVEYVSWRERDLTNMYPVVR